MYVLPNRKEFADAITRTFLKYRDKSSDTTRAGYELFTYQKFVKDYLLIETPYRGLLLYHGLGSGKTCSSVAVAESLMNTKKVFVMLPASLRQNYLEEIRKCGDPIYAFDQHWVTKKVNNEEDKEAGKALGISDSYLDKHLRYFVTVPHQEANFRSLPREQQKGIEDQIDDIIHQRFTFINYNGISSANVDKVLPPDQPHMFDNSVVIIDEAHNFIGSVLNERQIKQKLYDMMYHAKNLKIVCLSGTPMINRPQEIAFMMNLLRGPIERIGIPTKSTSWDENLMTTFFRQLKDVDTIEYNSVKRTIYLTRNPPQFESVYNEKAERIAVKYNRDFEQNPDIRAWVSTWKAKFVEHFGTVEIAEADQMIVEELECLPTSYEEFMGTFIDGLNVKNALLFQRRIQGLVSYFRGADEALLPKRLDEEKTLKKIPMSDYQYLRYLEERHQEILKESRKSRMRADLNEELGTFRIASRLVCDYAVPSDLKVQTDGSEDTEVEKPEILEKMKANPEKYLSKEALKSYSPKMLQMLEDIEESIGKEGHFRNQFVYSQHKTLEGLGIFSAILEANGFQRYKIIKENGIWREDPHMKSGIASYALYVGGTSEKDIEERNLYLQIFNQKYSDTFPQSLKDSIKEHRLCIFMASSAGAEGITTANVREVYVMEPHWNPARIEQVIGRAIRIGSHNALPPDERTVRVRMYLTVFSQEQTTSNEGPNIVSIRRNDMVLKRYDGTEPFASFMTSDEFLYEVSYEKGRIIKNISHLLKQAAVDCEIHRKLHTKERDIIQCMRFDSKVGHEDLAFRPNYKIDEKDELYQRNIIRKSRKLQIVQARGITIVLDPETNEIFDFSVYQDTNKLFRIGRLVRAGEIRFFSSVIN